MQTLYKKKKNITVNHVNIRLSISVLLSKLIFVELVAGTILIVWRSILVFIVRDVSILHAILLYGLPILIILVLIKAGITIFLITEWLNEYYEISADKIIYRRGIFFRKVEEFPLADVKFVEVQMGTIGKMLNFGSITLYNYRSVRLKQMYLIHNPNRYAHVIEDQVPNLVVRKDIK